MQMRPSRAPAHAHVAHYFATLDPLAFLHGTTLHMAVFGNNAAAVIDLYTKAVCAVAPRKGHNALGGHNDGRADAVCDVEPFVELPPATKRPGTPAKAGRNETHNRPDGRHGRKSIAVFAQGKQQILLAHFFKLYRFRKPGEKFKHLAGCKFLSVQGQIGARKVPRPVARRAGHSGVFFHVHHNAQLGVEALHPLKVAAHHRDTLYQINKLAALLFNGFVRIAQVVAEVAGFKPVAQQPDIAGHQGQHQQARNNAKPAAHAHIAAAATTFGEDDYVIFAEQH